LKIAHAGKKINLKNLYPQEDLLALLKGKKRLPFSFKNLQKYTFSQFVYIIVGQ
jgi:hypothetical protein